MGRPQAAVRLSSLIAGFAVLAALSGCKPVGPNYTRPGNTAPEANAAGYKETGAPSVVVPPPNPNGGTWKPATPSDGMLKGKWWETYNDPQLNKFEERVASDNVKRKTGRGELSCRARPGAFGAGPISIRGLA